MKFTRNLFSSLKIRNYRLYLTGQAISLSGTWMQTVGQAWLVLTLTNSGTALGFVLALQFLPILLFGAWGGVIVDRFSKRKLLYYTQAASGALALILGILVATHLVQLWMVDVLAFMLGLVNAIDNPARQSFVMEMVGREEVANAVSLNAAQTNIARVIGPAIGGILIAALGLAPLFILNALSYVAVLIALFRMDERALNIAPLSPKTIGKVKAGWRYVMDSPELKHALIVVAIIGTFTYEFSVSLPLFAGFALHGGAGTYAALTSALGVGSALGGLYAATRRSVGSNMLVRASLLFGVTMFMASAAPNLPFAIGALVFVGFFSINFISLANTLIQLASSPEMRGRVMSFWAVAVLGSTPIGGPIIGWVGEVAGPRACLVVGGVAAIVASGYLAWVRRSAPPL